MKKIVYTDVNGNLCIVHPLEGARLAYGATLPSGKTIKFEKTPIDKFAKKWPISGLNPLWAETEQEFIERIISKDIPTNASNINILEEQNVPKDREFRNAWKLDASGISIDMQKAKELKRQKLRLLRIPFLKNLDTEYLRADENGDTAEKQRIAQQKQALRDVTSDPAIEAASTPEELKAVMPDILK